MKIYKKLFRRCMCFFFVIVFGLLTCLQGFCSSSQVYYIKDGDIFSPYSVSASSFDSNLGRRFVEFNVTSTYSFSCCYMANNYDSSGSDVISLFPPFSSDIKYRLKFNIAFYSLSSTCKVSSSSLNLRFSYFLKNGESRQLSNIKPISFTPMSSGYYGYWFSFDFSLPADIDSVTSFYFSNSFISSFSGNFRSAFEFITLSSSSGSDEIINQFGSNYSQPNTSNFDNYNKAESSLYGGVESAIGGVNSQWNNINGDLLQYQGSFLAFNTFFNKLTDIPFIKIVLIISVAIGIFALLLGAVSTIVKHRGD